MARLRLTPLENETLSILEEAGEENLACVLNTLSLEPTDDGSVPHEFRTAVERLLRLGFVTISDSAFAPGAALQARYDAAEAHWHNIEPWQMVELTPSGEHALRH